MSTDDLTSGLVEAAELIQWYVGVWHDLGYAEPLPSPDCKPIPPLGERSAKALVGRGNAIDAIDSLMRQLHKLRHQLVDEGRQDAAIRDQCIDQVLGNAKAIFEPKVDPRIEQLRAGVSLADTLTATA